MFKKSLIVAVALAFASASAVSAADTKAWRVTNNSAAAAKQLDLTFGGTGGSLRVVVYGQDNPCPDSTVSVNQGLGTASIAYPTDCVRIKGVILLKGETNNGPISISSGFWTDAANATSNITVGSDNVQITVPTVSQWGLIVMTIALLIAATIIFARRKSVVATA